jgi:hypothetical protein
VSSLASRRRRHALYALIWADLRREGSLGELPWAGGDDDMRYMAWSRLIYDVKDRLLPPVAVADDHLHDDDSIEAPAEHPTG